MAKKVKVIVLRTAGTNCDVAMKFSIISNIEKTLFRHLEELWPRKQVAEYFHTSLVTLREWEKWGILPQALRMGSRVLFRKSDILKTVEGRRRV